MSEAFVLVFSLLFVQNFVLAKFLGLCPFIGVSKNRSTALSMGIAVIFVMALASAATQIFHALVLAPRDLGYLTTVSFILIIASLVQFVEAVLRKTSPTLYRALGIYLPLITTNCAVLGVAFLNLGQFQGRPLAAALGWSTLAGAAGGAGFTLALYLMAGIRERIERAPVPVCFRGVPIAFLAAACMALAFFGFAGIV